MDTDIRKYIINNFKDSSIEDIKTSIIESINSHDEVVLPGLGVLFEIMWRNESLHEQVLQTIYNEIRKNH